MFNFKTNLTPSNWAECMYSLLQTLASSGWQVIAWSNGSAFQNTPVTNAYPYSSNNIGVTQSSDLNNDRSYFVVQQPPLIAGSNGGGVGAPWSGTRQLKFQRGTTSALWRVAYSFSGAYTNPNVTGSARVAPAPNTSSFFNDEVFIAGGGTDLVPTYSTLFAGTEGGSRFNCFVDNGSLTGSLSGSLDLTGTIPNPRPYGWYMTTFNNGGQSAPSTTFLMDPLVSGTFPPQEVDPFVFYFDAASGDTLTMGTTAQDFGTYDGALEPKTWFRKGLAGNQFAGVAALRYTLRNASSIEVTLAPGNMGSNAHTNFDDFLPTLYARPVTTTQGTGFGGWKGISSMTRISPRTLTIGITFSAVTSRDRISMGHVILPWDASNVLV